jgi:hypothetical protein
MNDLALPEEVVSAGRPPSLNVDDDELILLAEEHSSKELSLMFDVSIRFVLAQLLNAQSTGI